MKRNYWPHAIVLTILGSIVASFFTIKIALQNSVVDSNLFLQNYHITDKNINQILGEQAEFNSLYNLDFSKSVVSENGINFKISVKNSNGDEVEAKFEALVTRPETSEFDKVFNSSKFKFDFPKTGRWNVYLKTTTENLTAYYYFETDTRTPEKLQIINPFVSHKRFEKMEAVRLRSLEK
jgi:hypothetical protein